MAIRRFRFVFSACHRLPPLLCLLHLPPPSVVASSSPFSTTFRHCFIFFAFCLFSSSSSSPSVIIFPSPPSTVALSSPSLCLLRRFSGSFFCRFLTLSSPSPPFLCFVFSPYALAIHRHHFVFSSCHRLPSLLRLLHLPPPSAVASSSPSTTTFRCCFVFSAFHHFFIFSAFCHFSTSSSSPFVIASSFLPSVIALSSLPLRLLCLFSGSSSLPLLRFIFSLSATSPFRLLCLISGHPSLLLRLLRLPPFSAIASSSLPSTAFPCCFVFSATLSSSPLLWFFFFAASLLHLLCHFAASSSLPLLCFIFSFSATSLLRLLHLSSGHQPSSLRILRLPPPFTVASSSLPSAIASCSLSLRLLCRFYGSSLLPLLHRFSASSSSTPSPSLHLCRLLPIGNQIWSGASGELGPFETEGGKEGGGNWM